MSLNRYDHWQGDADKGTVVLQDDLNEVHIPKSLKNALVNHRYGRAIDPKNGQTINAYIREQYEHQEYPKLLYHPKFGQTPEPKLADYAAGATTPEQSIKAHESFRMAYDKWMKTNRIKEATDPEREKELLAKGWVAQPPKPKIQAGSPESDEI
jgi:hypothetical protein